MTALVRRAPGPSLVLTVVTVTFTIVGLVRGQVFLWIYLPALVACVLIVAHLDRRWGPIPMSLLWLLTIWAGLHLAGGLAPNPTGRTEILYGMWLIDGVLRYDQVVHGFGIGAAAATFAFVARDSGRPLLWGFGLSQGVGLVNETVENVFAAFVEGSNVGDLVNTAWDLAWHVIGALVAVGWMARRGLPQGVGSLTAAEAT